MDNARFFAIFLALCLLQVVVFLCRRPIGRVLGKVWNPLLAWAYARFFGPISDRLDSIGETEADREFAAALARILTAGREDLATEAADAVARWAGPVECPRRPEQEALLERLPPAAQAFFRSHDSLAPDGGTRLLDIQDLRTLRHGDREYIVIGEDEGETIAVEADTGAPVLYDMGVLDARGRAKQAEVDSPSLEHFLAVQAATMAHADGDLDRLRSIASRTPAGGPSS